MKRVHLTILIVFLLLTSCNEVNIDDNNIEIIKVEHSDAEIINHIDFFENVEYTILETSQNSIIHNIDRLYFFEDEIFILDKKQKTIFVFALDGRYIRKIGRIGRGPEEHMQIGDFSIDEENKEIIASMEIPKMVYRYDLSGNFINSFKVNDCYGAHVSVIGHKIVLAGVNEKLKYVIHEYDKFTGVFLKSTFEKCRNSYNYPMISGMKPTLVKSNRSYFNQPLDRTVIFLDDEVNKSKYLIDFGKGNLPNCINNELINFDIIGYCFKNNYKTLINGFRENDTYIFFRFEPISFVLYNKETKDTKVFSQIEDSNIGVSIYDIFPHDGSFNGIVSIMEPMRIIFRAELLERSNIEISDSVLYQLRDLVSESDNPILLRYSFR